jgi:putative lipoic acid-binding regulatory protein
MTKEDQQLLEFPCEFPIKIMGETTEEFKTTIVEIVRRHAPDTPESAFRYVESSTGKYLSITATITAESREQLDNLYRDITACELVKWAL